MKFAKYWKSLNKKEKERLAARMGTTYNYLSNIANGHRNAGPTVLRRIEPATRGQVKVNEI